MLEITILIEENELIDILNKQLSKRVNGNEETLIRQYIFDCVHSHSATFFYGPTNLTKWLDDTLSHLEVIYPSNPNYEHYLNLWESKEYEDNKHVVQNKLGNLLLIEELYWTGMKFI